MVHIAVIAVVECDMFGGESRLLNGDLDLLLIELFTAASLAAGGLELRDGDAQSLAGAAGRAGGAKQDSPETTPAAFQQLFVSAFRESACQTPDHAACLAGQVRAFVLGAGQFQFCDW